MSRKGVYDLEREVKRQYAEDKYSPRMYQAIRDLAEKILVVKHIATTKDQAKTISHEYAEHLYSRIISGVEVVCWTKYIMLGLRTFVDKYWKNNRKVVLEVNDITEQLEIARNCFGLDNYSDISKINMDEYLRTMSEFILKDVIKKSFTVDTLFNRRLYLSVLSSIFSNNTRLIGLDSSYYDYVNLIVKLVKVDLYKDMYSVIEDEDKEMLADMLSMDELFSDY